MDRALLLQAAEALTYEAHRISDQAATIVKYEPAAVLPLLQRREKYETLARALRKSAESSSQMKIAR